MDVQIFHPVKRARLMMARDAARQLADALGDAYALAAAAPEKVRHIDRALARAAENLATLNADAAEIQIAPPKLPPLKGLRLVGPSGDDAA